MWNERINQSVNQSLWLYLLYWSRLLLPFVRFLSYSWHFKDLSDRDFERSHRAPTLPGGTAPPYPSPTLLGFLWGLLLDPQTQEAISALMQPLRTQAEGASVHKQRLLPSLWSSSHQVHHSVELHYWPLLTWNVHTHTCMHTLKAHSPTARTCTNVHAHAHKHTCYPPPPECWTRASWCSQDLLRCLVKPPFISLPAGAARWGVFTGSLLWEGWEA